MQSMHACRNSTSVSSIHDFPYNKRNKKSLLQAAATIRERLLFESGFFSRAAFIQDFMVLLFCPKSQEDSRSPAEPVIRKLHGPGFGYSGICMSSSLNNKYGNSWHV